jgi:hypothetical protein
MGASIPVRSLPLSLQQELQTELMNFIIDPPASAFTRNPWWHTRGHFSSYQVLPARNTAV